MVWDGMGYGGDLVRYALKVWSGRFAGSRKMAQFNIDIYFFQMFVGCRCYRYVHYAVALRRPCILPCYFLLRRRVLAAYAAYCHPLCVTRLRRLAWLKDVGNDLGGIKV